MDTELKIGLLLGLGRALSSYVCQSLRAAAGRIENGSDKNLLCISLFFNGEVSEEDQDDLDAALTEVSSSLKTMKPLFYDYTLFERRDFPTPLPDVGVYGFSRDTILPRQIEPKELLGRPFYEQVYVSAYQSLLGRIPATLRSARISNEKDSFFFTFYLDEGFGAPDVLLLKQAAEAFIADFPGHTISTYFHNWPYPKILPNTGKGVFRRKETL